MGSGRSSKSPVRRLQSTTAPERALHDHVVVLGVISGSREFICNSRLHLTRKSVGADLPEEGKAPPSKEIAANSPSSQATTAQNQAEDCKLHIPADKGVHLEPEVVSSCDVHDGGQDER